MNCTWISQMKTLPPFTITICFTTITFLFVTISIKSFNKILEKVLYSDFINIYIIVVSIYVKIRQILLYGLHRVNFNPLIFLFQCDVYIICMSNNNNGWLRK